MAIPKYGTDRYEGINYERMRNYRLNRTKEMMKKHGLGCLVTWDAFSIRYITGTYVTIPTRWIESQAVILPVNGDPYVYAGGGGRPSRMIDEMPWLKGKIFPGGIGGKRYLTIESLEPFVKIVADIMAEHGVTNQPVGLDCCTSELLWQEALNKAGIKKVVDGKACMFEARMKKSRDEIECIRMACANAEAAFADIQAAVRPGVRECDIMAVGMNRLYREGADECQEFVCVSGEYTNPFRIDYTDRMIRPGDLIIIDINGNSWNGYKTCYYRTFCCGKPTPQQEETFEMCRDLMFASEKYWKPGASTLDIANAQPWGKKVFKGHGPDYWGYDTWESIPGYFAAHGIGISLHEFPWLMRDALPQTLEEGLVFTPETWAGFKGGKDGVRLEIMIAITKDGYERLDLWPVDKLTECWV